MSLIRRRMMMAVKKPSGNLPDYSSYRGVYIEDVDGYLYTEAEWDGSKTANGVAVLTDDCRFVVALKDTSMYTTWGGYGTLVEGIAVTEDTFGAMWDFDGKSNTSFALESLGNHLSGATAAYKCKNHIFPNGKDGYLGAGGEWQAVLNNLASVLNAIVKCGGDTFNGYHWTSSQNSPYNSWYVYWGVEMLYSASKNNGYNVRAFTTLKSEEGESPYAFSFNIEAEGASWTANDEQLVQINKMFAIVTKFLGMDGGEFNSDNAPQEFDLRINGVRNFMFYYSATENESDIIDLYISFNDGDGLWTVHIAFPWNNPVTNAFKLFPVN